MYMVQEALWKKAWEGKSVVQEKKKALEFTRGLFLCFTCLEKRIGRNLEIADFTDSPANELLHWGVKTFG